MGRQVSRLVLLGVSIIFICLLLYLVPMTWALQLGLPGIVRYQIFLGFGVNGDNGHGFSPLMAAASAGDCDFAKYLIDQGAAVNKLNGSSKSALMFASERGHLECVDRIITAGANINEVDEANMTALFLAVRSNHYESVKALLTAGADPNITASGISPVMLAVRRPNPPLVSLLLDYRASVDGKGPDGRTALELADMIEDPVIKREIMETLSRHSMPE